MVKRNALGGRTVAGSNGEVAPEVLAITPAVVSRQDAAAWGFTRYFSGLPCLRGHVAERRVIGNRCVECHRLAARRHRAESEQPREGRRALLNAVPAVTEWPTITELKSLFEVESHKTAIANGRTRYFTGEPCPAGHVDQRNVANQRCVACDRRKTSGNDRKRALELWNRVRALQAKDQACREWPLVTKEEAAKEGLKRFFIGDMCKRGHISPRYTGNGECVVCSRMRNRERYATDPEFRQHRIDSEVVRNRRPDVRETRRLNAVEYNRRPTVRARLLERIKTDSLFRTHWNIKTLLRNTLKKHRHKKMSKMQDILGCSIDEFREHIAKQFTGRMNWNNYGEWEFDHIVALSTAKDGADVMALFHHTNIRPLNKGPNRSKGSRSEYLI